MILDEDKYLAYLKEHHPGGLPGFISVQLPTVSLNSLSLDANDIKQLKMLVSEYRQSDKLRSYGLPPAKRLLLLGSDGSGKTFTAKTIAGECNLPLYIVQLNDMVLRSETIPEVSKYLRETFKQLMVAPTSVWFFQDVEALQDNQFTNETKTLKNILYLFIHLAKQNMSEHLLVAGFRTTYEHYFDSTLCNQFDVVLDYSVPLSNHAIKQLIQNRLAIFDTESVDWDVVTGIMVDRKLSCSEVVFLAVRAAKNLVLSNDGKTMTTKHLMDTINALPY